MRSLTDAEAEKLGSWGDHTNHAFDSYCCPHCLESSVFRGIDRKPVVVTCPLCSHEFAAWSDTEIVYRSARLPDPGEGA